jgi:CRISPR/Cas system CMR subunit Cmr4 (Cas7 group RAMP superfamily)
MNSVLDVVDIPILRLDHTFIPSILISSTLKKKEKEKKEREISNKLLPS